MQIEEKSKKHNFVRKINGFEVGKNSLLSNKSWYTVYEVAENMNFLLTFKRSSLAGPAPDRPRDLGWTSVGNQRPIGSINIP